MYKPTKSKAVKTAKKATRTKKKPAPVAKRILPPADFEKIATIEKRVAVENAKREVEWVREEVRAKSERVNHHVREIEALKEQIKGLEASAPVKVAIAEKIAKEAEVITPEEHSRMRMLARLFSTHNGVAEVLSIKDSTVEYVTPLLFADIRKDSGSRSTVRTCIGAFNVKVTQRVGSDARVSVENLLFQEPRYHWAVSGEGICFGDWPQPKGVHDAVDIVHNILQSTNDGGAYMKSHEWRMQRKIPGVKSETPRVGSYVVGFKPYDGNRSAYDHDSINESRVGKVVEILRHRTLTTCVNWETGGGGVTRWWVNGSVLREITAAQYKAVKEREVQKMTPDEIAKIASEAKNDLEIALAQIDALPDGSWITDAQAIVNKYVA